MLKNYRLDRSLNQSEEGFSLVETMIALTTLGVCLAYAMPLFLYAKINNSKSDVRTGALIVTQRVFDDIRSRPFISTPVSPSDLPYTDGVANPSATNPEIKPSTTSINSNTVTPADKTLTYALGRQYQAKVIYCEGLAADTTVCSDKYRKFKVEINYNGSKVYALEGTFTDFK